MRHGSLFSGIGGFDLAAEWMGWENIFHCEWMEFPRKVLDYYWPNADSHIDICKTDFTKYANTIDILTGGFPCQPFSLAGKRKGTDDERYLWHEMLRAIREIKPKWVIAENVFGIVNIDGGMVFEQVCVDLENEGYEVQPFIIPAAAKDAPHRRDRVWFVAHAKSIRSNRTQELENSQRQSGEWWGCNTNDISQIHGENRCTVATDTDSSTTGPSRTSGSVESNGGNRNLFTKQWRKPSQFNNRLYALLRNATDTDSASTKYTIQTGGNLLTSCVVNGNATNTMCKRQSGKEYWNTQSGQHCKNSQRNDWHNFPTQSPICSGDDGLPTKLDGITFPKWRNESIKGYGNAIVPQIAYQLFQIIENESKNQNT